MAAPLLATSPVFRAAVAACAEALRPHGVDLLAEFGKEEGWKHPALAMVGLVAVQVGGAPFGLGLGLQLCLLWSAWSQRWRNMLGFG